MTIYSQTTSIKNCSLSCLPVPLEADPEEIITRAVSSTAVIIGLTDSIESHISPPADHILAARCGSSKYSGTNLIYPPRSWKSHEARELENVVV